MMSTSFSAVAASDRKQIRDYLYMVKNKPIAICTWGLCGKILFRWCEENDISVDAIFDNDSKKIGDDIFGIKVDRFEKIRSLNRERAYVVATYNQYTYNAIYDQLIDCGVNSDSIFHITLFENSFFSSRFDYLYYKKQYKNSTAILGNLKIINQVIDLLSDERSKEVYLKMLARHYNCYEFTIPKEYADYETYFERDFFQFSDNEILIQCGVMDGITIEEFIKVVPDYKKIIGVEADNNNYIRSKWVEEKYDNVRLINKAISNTDGEEIEFCALDTGRSHIYSYGDVVLENTRDNAAMGESVHPNQTVASISGDSLNEETTFIQMDIEGAELDALHGFEKTITRRKPKLAICIYHSIYDFWNIPLYVHQLVPEYKLFVRNDCRYAKNNETILFATI